MKDKKEGTLLIRSSAGPIASLDFVTELYFRWWDKKLGPFSPQPSHYTNYAIPEPLEIPYIPK
jgi:hypothetical protein